MASKIKQELLTHFLSKAIPVRKRIAMGKALRKEFPRIRLGDYNKSPDRPDPVSILEAQAKTRLQDLVPIRYARMLASPFAFLRGGAAIMAADLAATRRTTGIQVQLCGDMHVANFGLFASAERKLIFGINDFDETLPGPWEWDMKRMLASIVVSCRFLGGDDRLCRESVNSAISSYRRRIKQFAYTGNLELWYTTITDNDLIKKLAPFQRDAARKISAKARQQTHLQVLDKLTDILDDKYRLRENAPFIIRETHTQAGRTINEALGLFLESYTDSLADDRKALLKKYRFVDVVKKIVGVGSVGTRCWVVFLSGISSGDPLFLQIKEAQPSVLEQYADKSVYSNQGERVVAGQRLIQGAPDIFLGWGEQDGVHFYVRQLRDMKGGLEFDPKKIKVKNFPLYTSACGWALALAHAKSGDAAMLAGYVGNSDELDEAMSRFAFAYADQNDKDYNALVKAAKSGRIKVAESAS